MNRRHDELHVAPQFAAMFREAGIDAEAVFSHPDIKVWRKLDDRENCTLDVPGWNRMHVKRYPISRSMEVEVRGIRLLEQHQIPTLTLAGWGKLMDGRSFVITEDLSGFEDSEKLLERGEAFSQMLEPTAAIAAKLHLAKLHHRDLYLCHFFTKLSSAKSEVRLIDAARVAPLTNRLTRKRWIVKDLAQFWYSTLALPVTDAQRDEWLDRYSLQTGMKSLRAAVVRKSNWIAKHDAALRRAQPDRNRSIPTPSSGRR